MTVIIGNKSDMESLRSVSIEDAKALAKETKSGFLETSAKNNVNIDEAFILLASAILNKMYQATSLNLVEEAKALELAFQVMTVVPNQANDMMDIGRLQGFEVSSYYVNYRLLSFEMLNAFDLELDLQSILISAG